MPGIGAQTYAATCAYPFEDRRVPTRCSRSSSLCSKGGYRSGTVIPCRRFEGRSSTFADAQTREFVRRLAIPFCRSAHRAREWGIRSIYRSPDRTKESARLRVQGVARRNGSDHPAASDLANVRACSANRSATGLSVRFLSVISIVGTVQVGSSIGSTLIHS